MIVARVTGGATLEEIRASLDGSCQELMPGGGRLPISEDGPHSRS